MESVQTMRLLNSFKKLTNSNTPKYISTSHRMMTISCWSWWGRVSAFSTIQSNKKKDKLYFKCNWQKDFWYKSLSDGQIRIMINNIDYRKTVKYLDSIKVCFRTYQPKQERLYRVVIKDNLFSTALIKNITLLRHKARNEPIVKSRILYNRFI